MSVASKNNIFKLILRRVWNFAMFSRRDETMLIFSGHSLIGNLF